MDGLVPGRIVYFVFDDHSASAVNRRRTDSESIRRRLATFEWPEGAQAHIGTPVKGGDIAPAMVVWVGQSAVSLKVMLDGSDTYWATNVVHDGELRRPGTWHWMFQGQAARYEPRMRYEPPVDALTDTHRNDR